MRTQWLLWCSCLALAASNAWAGTLEVSLHNDTREQVRALWIAPAGSEEWRRVELAEGGLATGREQRLRWQRPAGEGCVYDLRVDLRRGWNFLHRGADFCRYDSYRLSRYLRGVGPGRPVALRDERVRAQVGVAAKPED